MEKELHETTLFPRKALRPMSLARLDNLFVCLCLNYSSFHWKVNMKNLQLQVVFEQFFDCGVSVGAFVLVCGEEQGVGVTEFAGMVL